MYLRSVQLLRSSRVARTIILFMPVSLPLWVARRQDRRAPYGINKSFRACLIPFNIQGVAEGGRGRLFCLCSPGTLGPKYLHQPASSVYVQSRPTANDIGREPCGALKLTQCGSVFHRRLRVCDVRPGPRQWRSFFEVLCDRPPLARRCQILG